MSVSVARYLHIPPEYVAALGGLRWAAAGDLIETDIGTTFAFGGQIAAFLEGLAAQRPLPHFAHVLHLLHLLGVGPISECPAGLGELRRAFLLESRPLRNAGVLCAGLVSDLPGCAFPPELWQLRQELIRPNALFGMLVLYHHEQPPLQPGEFEQRILAALTHFSPDELRHWMKYGCAPAEPAAERVAAEIERRPANLLEALGEAACNRERLAGALTLVPALTGALSLPARRLEASQLPLGGYADVTTRGEPEHLLPSQFALDGLEFVRRFAEKELLYFRREEPHRPDREELVLLLDQGVRTWGGVRLALAGAVFAFARFAQRRNIGFRFATSREGEPRDPLQVSANALGTLLEASDLTPHPGPALERLLNEPNELARDIVILTHPRSLMRGEVAAAAQQLRPGDRLFAVGVDGEGQGQLAELRDGRPVPLSRFRVDLAGALRVTTAALSRSEPASSWSGDVEPVPFPFWFGPTGKLLQLALDAEGRWLLVAATGGVPHLVEIDGPRREVLPRGYLQGQVLRDPVALLGTSDGFIVSGKMKFESPVASFELRSDELSGYSISTNGPRPVAIHYDLARRRMTAHAINAAWEWNGRWYYLPEENSVVYRNKVGCFAVDLGTGGRHPPPSPAMTLVSRAISASARAEKLATSPPGVPLLNAESDQYGLHFDWRTGSLRLCGTSPPWARQTLLADGQPALRFAAAYAAQHAGSTLAFHSASYQEYRRRVLMFHGPDCTPVGEYVPFQDQPLMHLSANGSRFALQTNHLEVSVFDTTGGRPPVATLSPGQQSSEFRLELGRGWLAAITGKKAYLFRWHDGALKFQYERSAAPSFLPQQLAGLYSMRTSATKPVALQGLLASDPARFPLVTSLHIRAAVDTFGQIWILDRRGERLLAALRIGRGRAAAWMPDGTRWGDGAWVGTSTVGAAERMARKLREAEM